MKKVFRSKVDLWLAVGMIAFSILSVGIVSAMLAPMNLGAWPALAFALFIILSALVMAAPVRYVLDEEYLTIRSGLFVKRIPLRKIEVVPTTRTFWTAPAWSFDRIQLRYDQKYIQVSPDKHDLFLQQVQNS